MPCLCPGTQAELPLPTGWLPCEALCSREHAPCEHSADQARGLGEKSVRTVVVDSQRGQTAVEMEAFALLWSRACLLSHRGQVQGCLVHLPFCKPSFCLSERQPCGERRMLRLCPWARVLSDAHRTGMPCSQRPSSIFLSPCAWRGM